MRPLSYVERHEAPLHLPLEGFPNLLICADADTRLPRSLGFD
jgi:hypothetical protein